MLFPTYRESVLRISLRHQEYARRPRGQGAITSSVRSLQREDDPSTEPQNVWIASQPSAKVGPFTAEDQEKKSKRAGDIFLNR